MLLILVLKGLLGLCTHTYRLRIKEKITKTREFERKSTTHICRAGSGRKCQIHARESKSRHTIFLVVMLNFLLAYNHAGKRME